MEKTEKSKSHPTRNNIFINLEDGLMYERIEGGWHNMIEQELTECQELEIYICFRFLYLCGVIMSPVDPEI